MAVSSSVGSDIAAVLALLLVSTIVLFVIRYYLPLRSTPAYLLVPVFLALVLPCSIILLVPIDLASANSGQEIPSRGIWLPERVVLVTWRITYWLTFMLTWFILPFLGEYSDSGYLELTSRAKDSLRSNARYQLVVLVSGTVGLIYFVLQNGFHWATLKGLVMALAYAWGLFLAIGLMGHGLVALPRRLYTFASVQSRLQRVYAQAPKTKDRLDDAEGDLEMLENVIVQLKQRKQGASREIQEWVDELSENTAVRRAGLIPIRPTDVNVPAVITERYLADLTRKLKRARHKKARFVDEWTQLCHSARRLELVSKSAETRSLDLGQASDRPSGMLSNLKILTPTMRYHLRMNVEPILRVALAGILAVASVMVIWSEVVKSFAPNLSVIGLTVVHHLGSDKGAVGFAGQFIAAIWLIYMDICALYAIADVKVWGNRALVKRQTYAESACWYSLQVAKLTVPLSYNFITMLPPAVYSETSFFTFLGKLISITPLGQGFSTFFPCFILLPVLASLFNVYGRLKRVIGFSVLDDESDINGANYGTGGWREGKALIQRELNSGTGLSSSSVGLSSRDTSVDIERRPLAPSSRMGASSSSTDASSNRQREPQHHNARDTRNINDDDDDSPRHFYQDFSERFRNTFDTTDAADWVKNIGSSFKTPTWLQRDSAGGSSGGNTGLSKWFGGRANDGQLRL